MTARMRLAREALDAVSFALLANGDASGSSSLTVRTRRVGARIWLTIANKSCSMTALKLAKARQSLERARDRRACSLVVPRCHNR